MITLYFWRPPSGWCCSSPTKLFFTNSGTLQNLQARNHPANKFLYFMVTWTRSSHFFPPDKNSPSFSSVPHPSKCPWEVFRFFVPLMAPACEGRPKGGFRYFLNHSDFPKEKSMHFLTQDVCWYFFCIYSPSVWEEDHLHLTYVPGWWSFVHSPQNPWKVIFLLLLTSATVLLGNVVEAPLGRPAILVPGTWSFPSSAFESSLTIHEKDVFLMDFGYVLFAVSPLSFCSIVV